MKRKSLRLFKNPLLEKLSRVHPLGPILFWGLVISILLWRSHTLFFLNAKDYLILGSTAFLTWTFVEYALHRFLFHFTAKGPMGKRLVYIFHGVHHQDPYDPFRSLMPLTPAVAYALPLYFLFLWLLGEKYSETFLAFFLLSYLVYDYLHFSLHTLTPRTKIGKFLRKHHLIHHAQEYKNFGVSSPLWDYVFNTVYKKRLHAEMKGKTEEKTEENFHFSAEEDEGSKAMYESA